MWLVALNIESFVPCRSWNTTASNMSIMSTWTEKSSGLANNSFLNGVGHGRTLAHIFTFVTVRSSSGIPQMEHMTSLFRTHRIRGQLGMMATSFLFRPESCTRMITFVNCIESWSRMECLTFRYVIRWSHETGQYNSIEIFVKLVLKPSLIHFGWTPSIVRLNHSTSLRRSMGLLIGGKAWRNAASEDQDMEASLQVRTRLGRSACSWVKRTLQLLQVQRLWQKDTKKW